MPWHTEAWGDIFFTVFMKVSTSQPYQIIYSLFEHEFLGYLFESFVVQLDDNRKLTLRHQNISSQNAPEFANGLDASDYEMIKLMDSMQQEAVIRKFYKSKIKPRDFFEKVYKTEKKDELLLKEIQNYLERRRAAILELVPGKMLFEMGNDGEPTWRQIEIMPEKASVLFHFRRNEDNTHYFPTIKYAGEKIDFQSCNSYIVCRDPAWLICNGKLYGFNKYVDGHKLLPFLKKRYIVVPKNVEDMYYRKFIAPLVGTFDVYAKGFDIKTYRGKPQPVLSFSEMQATGGDTMSLFADAAANEENAAITQHIVFDLSFQYGPYSFRTDNAGQVSVKVEQEGDHYTFYRIERNLEAEKNVLSQLRANDLQLKHSKYAVSKSDGILWISRHQQLLEEMGVALKQKSTENKRYFLGKSSITVEVQENIDWFDILAIVRFGDYEIPFKELRRVILRKNNEIVLPNGEIGVIPDAWITEYSELFAFADDSKVNGENLTLKKYHLALVKDLETGQLAKVTMSRKLEQLRNFEEIEEEAVPAGFVGDLRPYQKAGYNWLQFLNKYKFGGCLADDMGLGKTIQTLAMLQALKERGEHQPSLLIVPTSLIYNWEVEAGKFTPSLALYIYSGTGRVKNPATFEGKDLIITSYGITRLDIDILKNFHFNYVILDESQAIKNPNSIISKAVRKLHARNKLILTGTPLENSTLDLWSQMSFVNPGLLGNQGFFKKEFLMPIEKKNDTEKTRKLYTIIKPFIMRRHKSQVATELPEKVESVKYCSMTTMQEERYEEIKTQFRNKILDVIEEQGVKKSQILLLQGLSKLRQLANHPKMIDPDYQGDSGKMDTVTHMLMSTISEDHKVLIFSQFVKHLSILSHYLDQQQVAYAYLDGATRDRQHQVEQFQNNPDIKVFLISLKAGGVGLNLTEAEYVFILDPWWNPAVEQQAMDRAHRIGQKNKVFTYKFITKNTVEEKILLLQSRKKRLATELISTEESFVKSLSQDDIAMLLE
jgi:SNF2 family DNA or RNA helicase